MVGSESSDTRLASQQWGPPPATVLSSAASIGSFEFMEEPLCSATAYLECAFYHLELPADWQQASRLPPIRAATAGIPSYRTGCAGDAVPHCIAHGLVMGAVLLSAVFG